MGRRPLQARSLLRFPLVIFFVAGNFFNRKKRPKRQTDDVPVRPLVEFVAFWTLLSLGAFCAAISGFALLGGASLGFHLTRALTVAMVAVAIAAIVLIERAFVFWWRMRS